MTGTDKYFKFTNKARMDKALNTLLGILQGIAADKTINNDEMKLLGNWVEENMDYADRHPYNELFPLIFNAEKDGVLSHDEYEDILWGCQQAISQEYYDLATADIQTLQAIVAGIASDGLVTETEVELLAEWLVEREHLRKCWPYDEVDTLVTAVLKDRWIDPAEQKMLLKYFSTFIPNDLNFSRPTTTSNTLLGICVVAPEIIFEGSTFCFTGESKRAPREEMQGMAIDRGGRVVSSVSPKVNYLIVGSGGNPCWAYACYGRKIEKAMQLRKEGAPILIIHEADYFDSVA
jgi:hypothetical protein